MKGGFARIKSQQERVTGIGVILGLGFQHLLFCIIYNLLKLPKNLIVSSLQFTLEEFELLGQDILRGATAGNSPTFLNQGEEGVMRKPHLFKFENNLLKRRI